jgi:hypothetical protein
MERIPYQTRSGLKIGSNYTPPKPNRMTREEEVMQGILLGIEPEWSQKRIAILVGYFLLFVTLFSALVMMKD